MIPLRPIDLSLLDDLWEFARGRGYVLDFSDASFAEFFATQLDVDIYDAAYAEFGTSKGKRLRCFLSKVDQSTLVRTLEVLWEHRQELLIRTGQDDPVLNAAGRFLTLMQRLTGQPSKATGESIRVAYNWRLMGELLDELARLKWAPAHERGYRFEIFLKQYFDAAGLKARDPFRNVGEQIDGSFVLKDQTYLLEAKWQAQPTGVGDLHAFHGKIEQKAAWTRGLFVSHAGFTEVGMTAFGPGKRLICMDGLDIENALTKQLPLSEVLERKIRRAAETGKVFVPVSELF